MFLISFSFITHPREKVCEAESGDGKGLNRETVGGEEGFTDKISPSWGETGERRSSVGVVEILGHLNQ